MAKIILGGIVSDIRGSVAGVTFRGGAAGATLSSKAAGRRSRSGAQTRQMNLIAESRRAWGAMSPAQQKAFTFVYTQKLGFRPGVGRSWASGQGAFTAWHVGLRLCGLTPGVPTTPLAAWGYDGGGATGLFSTGFFPSDGLYSLGIEESQTPMCIWGIRPGPDNMPPARPVWTLIYCGLTDPAAPVVDVFGYGIAWDFTAYLTARGGSALVNTPLLFKAYRANSDIALVFNERIQVLGG
jgi:hypothetical protein